MKKEFTKADLKDGMVVEYRNGNRFLVLGDRMIGEVGYDFIAGCNETLEDIRLREKQYDIVRVYRSRQVRSISEIFLDEFLELIWERNKSKKMTAEEMRKKLEELTGEKIEPSIEEKYMKLVEYCDGKECFSECILEGGVHCGCKFDGEIKHESNVEECYQKIIGQEK